MRQCASAAGIIVCFFLSDHKTLTSTRGHDGDPVPYMLYDSRVDTKAGLPYTEKSGEKGPYVNSEFR